jgi:CubicO group peptidase (beta-lactamase class C family)
MKQILEALPEQELIYPPGTQYKYSNLGIALLGEVVASASGMSYEKFVTENILKPLEMNSSSVILKETDKKNLVTPYSHRFPDGSRRVMPFTEAKGIAPAANITSNIEDLAKYISLQFRKGRKGGNQILDSHTLEDMQRIQWLNPGWTSGYGLGFRVWKQDNYTVVGHGGWVAGNRTQISFIPKDKIGVVVLTNADDVSPAFFARKILELMTPVIKSATSPEVQTIKADPSWEKYLGIYTDASWYDTEVMIYNNQLVMNGYSYPPEDTPDSEIKILVPEEKNTFRMSGPNGNGERVVFEMDNNDKVIRIKVGENYIFPKK